jgi:hypothetical protein
VAIYEAHHVHGVIKKAALEIVTNGPFRFMPGVRFNGCNLEDENRAGRVLY